MSYYQITKISTLIKDLERSKIKKKHFTVLVENDPDLSWLKSSNNEFVNKSVAYVGFNKKHGRGEIQLTYDDRGYIIAETPKDNKERLVKIWNLAQALKSLILRERVKLTDKKYQKLLAKYQDKEKPKPSIKIKYLQNTWGEGMQWFAVKVLDQDRLLEALHAEDAEEIPWDIGIDKAYSGYTIITPPVKGWIFILGINAGPELSNRILPAEYDGDKLDGTLEVLSREYGEAHFYQKLESANLNTWIKARNGKIETGYIEADDQIMRFGTNPPKEDDDYTSLDKAAEWSIDLEELPYMKELKDAKVRMITT